MAIIGGRAHNIEQIHEIANLGYPYAEISLYDPDVTEAQIDELLKIKETYRISYLAHYPNEDNPFDVNILHEKFSPKIMRLIDLSLELGIVKGTIHFWIDKRWAPPELIPPKIELLKELVCYATSRGVVLCIENLSERYDSFENAFKSIPDLRMTLDIGHGQLLSKENTSFDFFEYVYDKIEHIHVHDNFGGTSVKDDLHLGLGQGSINYPEILSILNKKGYNKTITMEVKPHEMAKSKEYLLRFI